MWWMSLSSLWFSQHRWLPNSFIFSDFFTQFQTSVVYDSSCYICLTYQTRQRFLWELLPQSPSPRPHTHKLLSIMNQPFNFLLHYNLDHFTHNAQASSQYLCLMETKSWQQQLDLTLSMSQSRSSAVTTAGEVRDVILIVSAQTCVEYLMSPHWCETEMQKTGGKGCESSGLTSTIPLVCITVSTADYYC